MYLDIWSPPPVWGGQNGGLFLCQKGLYVFCQLWGQKGAFLSSFSPAVGGGQVHSFSLHFLVSCFPPWSGRRGVPFFLQ